MVHVSFISAVQRDGENRSGFHVHGVFGLASQKRVTILHLGDARVGIYRAWLMATRLIHLCLVRADARWAPVIQSALTPCDNDGRAALVFCALFSSTAVKHNSQRSERKQRPLLVSLSVNKGARFSLIYTHGCQPMGRRFESYLRSQYKPFSFNACLSKHASSRTSGAQVLIKSRYPVSLYGGRDLRGNDPMTLSID